MHHVLLDPGNPTIPALFVNVSCSKILQYKSIVLVRVIIYRLFFSNDYSDWFKKCIYYLTTFPSDGLDIDVFIKSCFGGT